MATGLEEFKTLKTLKKKKKEEEENLTSYPLV